MLGRIYGDGFERVKRIHTRLDCKTCAEREIFLRNYGAVGDNTYVKSGICENTGSVEGLIDKLNLACTAECRADRNGIACTYKLVYYKMPFGTVLDGQLNAEFLCDTDSGADVVRTVCVSLERNLAAHYGKHCVELHIKSGLL